MKIAEADVIKNGEQELIDAITGDLDWSTIERLLLEKHKFKLQDEVEYRRGDIVVHENAIAYRLDFDVKVSLSVLFNRKGDCLELSTSGEIGEKDDEVAPETDEVDSLAQAHADGFETDDSIPHPTRGEDPGMDLVDRDLDTEGFDNPPQGDVAGVAGTLETDDDEFMGMMIDEDTDSLEPVIGVDLDETDLDIGPMFDDSIEPGGMVGDDSDLDGTDLDIAPMFDDAAAEEAGQPGSPDMMVKGEEVKTGDSHGEQKDPAVKMEASPLDSTEHISQMASQIAEMISEINDK